jgi:hypothetical protein
MSVKKKSSVLFGLVLGILFLFTQGAWAVEVLYAPFEDYYLVFQGTLIPHTTVYVVGDMPPNPPPLQPWACQYINGQQTSLKLGKVGKCFQFNGAQFQYIKVPDRPMLNIETRDFAITFWIRTNAASVGSETNFIIDKRSAPGNGYYVCLFNGCPRLGMGTSVFTVPNAPNTMVNDGKAHHVAIFVQRNIQTGVKIYINGVIAFTGNPSPIVNITNNGPLYIGRSAITSPIKYFTGALDEVEIFRAQ